MSAGGGVVELVAYEEAVDHFQAALQAIELGVPTPPGPRSTIATRPCSRSATPSGGRATSSPRRGVRRGGEVGRRVGRADHLARATLGYGGGLGGAARPCGRTPRSSASSRKRSPPSARSAPPARAAARPPGDRAVLHAGVRPPVRTRRRGGRHRPGDRRPGAARCRLYSREAALWGPDRPPADRLAACDEIVALSQGSRERYMDLEARSLRIDALMVLGDIAAADQEHEARSREAEALRMTQYLAEVVAYPAARGFSPATSNRRSAWPTAASRWPSPGPARRR